mgnify:CR=1 FL=1
MRERYHLGYFAEEHAAGAAVQAAREAVSVFLSLLMLQFFRAALRAQKSVLSLLFPLRFDVLANCIFLVGQTVLSFPLTGSVNNLCDKRINGLKPVNKHHRFHGPPCRSCQYFAYGFSMVDIKTFPARNFQFSIIQPQ